MSTDDRHSSMPPVDPLLEIEALSVSLPFGSRRVDVVRGVDIVIGRGEVIGIAGESGSGKTLTALAILRLLPPSASVRGKAMLDGRNLLELDARALRNVRGSVVGTVFQDPMTSLHPMLTVERQLTEHVRFHLHVDQRTARARALELLEIVRIPDARNALRAHPHHFSGGMRQRLAIAMALACGPKLLIADEPTTALDVTIQAQILELLDGLRREQGLSIMLITHDLGVTAALSDRLYVLYAGEVVESGHTADILLRPSHPYTTALLAALPHMRSRGSKLEEIPGSPPHFDSLPSGCPFHPRCPRRQSSCAEDHPQLQEARDRRSLRCPIAASQPEAR